VKRQSKEREEPGGVEKERQFDDPAIGKLEYL